jgi:hypothetical protein
VAPFRDSYQTALFFTTMLALGDNCLGNLLPDNIKGDPWGIHVQGDPIAGQHLTPLVHEIAKNGAYQLTMPGIDSAEDFRKWRRCPKTIDDTNVSARIHPLSPRQLSQPMRSKRGWLWGVALFAIFICLAVNLQFVRETFFGKYAPWAYLALAPFLLVTLACFLLDQANPDGEPALLFQGISVWPTAFLRVFAGFVCVLFIVAATSDLRHNLNEIYVDYFGAARRKEPRAEGLENRPEKTRHATFAGRLGNVAS